MAGETSWRLHLSPEGGPHRRRVFREVHVSDSAGRFDRINAVNHRNFITSFISSAKLSCLDGALSSCYLEAAGGEDLLHADHGTERGGMGVFSFWRMEGPNERQSTPSQI